MSIVYLLIILGIVLVVVAAVVVREARRRDSVPPKPVFDLEEAVDFVADRLPDDITARLGFGDVEQLITWDLEYIRSKGVAGNGTAPRITEKVVVGGTEVIDYVLQRADAAGMDVTPGEVHTVLECTLQYLAAIHAVGSEAPVTDRQETSDRPRRLPDETISGLPKPKPAPQSTPDDTASDDGDDGDASGGEGEGEGGPSGGPQLPGSLN